MLLTIHRLPKRYISLSYSHMKQRTIKQAVTLSGVGLHTGSVVNITFKPAPEDHGFKFIRTDLENQPVIQADVNRVISTDRNTCLQVGDAKVQTVEHALSALRGLSIDNALIEIDAQEVPIMDGSAKTICRSPTRSRYRRNRRRKENIS